MPNRALSFLQWLKGQGKAADLFCWLSLQSYSSFSKAKRKNSFLPTQGIANSTWDLKTELCLLQIWHHRCEQEDLKLEWWLAILVFRAEAGSALQAASRISSHTGHMVCQTGNGLISQNSFSFSLYFHMSIANSPDSYQITILGSIFHCTKKFQSKNTKAPLQRDKSQSFHLFSMMLSFFLEILSLTC